MSICAFDLNSMQNSNGKSDMQVLVVEDDELIASGLAAGLQAHGMKAVCVTTAVSAEQAIYAADFDVMVLDLGLPDQDGLTLLKETRNRKLSLPVIVLTARDAIEYRIAGLQSGADDYVLKPFDLGELAARIHAVVRRSKGRATQEITAGPLRLDPQYGQVWLNEKLIALSRREFDILIHLANAAGHWLAPSTLRDRVFGEDIQISSNALNVHIHNIRRKLGAEAIETSRGLGFRLGWRL